MTNHPNNNTLRNTNEASQQSGFDFLSLPKDIQEYILTFLDLKDLRLSRVNRRFNSLFHDNSNSLTLFWRRILKNQFPDQIVNIEKRVRDGIVETNKVDWVGEFLAEEDLQYKDLTPELRKLFYYVKSGDTYRILNYGVSFNQLFVTDKNGDSLVTLAIENQNHEILRYYFLKLVLEFYIYPLHPPLGINNRKTDDRGWTLLHWMAYFPEAILGTTISRLLDFGWDINARTASNMTPLMLSAITGNSAGAQTLLDNGNNINFTSNTGYTAVYLASSNGKTEVVKLLTSHGADINITDHEYGSTPLLSAATYGYTECVRELISHHADVNMANKKGATPLFAAAQNGHQAIVELLIKNGADIDAKFPTKGGALLKDACKFSVDVQRRMADFVKRNAQPNSDDITMTAEQMAEIMGHDDIAEALSVKREQREFNKRYKIGM